MIKRTVNYWIDHRWRRKKNRVTGLQTSAVFDTNMTDFNYIQTRVNPLRQGKLTACYGGLQQATFKTAAHLKPTISNLLKTLTRGKPEHIQQALKEHETALFPALLKPFSDRRRIYQQRKRVADDLRRHVASGVDIAAVWPDFLLLWNLPQDMKQPATKNLVSYRYWLITLRRLTKKATYIYSTLAEKTDRYVPARYLQYSLALRHRYDTNFELYGERLTHTKLQMYSQYCRTSGYKVRSEGIANLAENRGLTPFAITITPRPRYVMHSSAWAGVTPFETSGDMSTTFKQVTDSFRHAGYDVEIIRVVEPQANGTPHLHLLLFCDINLIGTIENTFNEKFINAGICGTGGIYTRTVYDVPGQIGYMLKTLWGNLKYQIEYQDEIMAWGEFGAHRRFAITSTKYKYPSVKLLDDARRGRASLIKLYKGRLRDDVKNTPGAITEIEEALNNAAKKRDYPRFVRLFWDAIGTDETIKANKPKTVGIADLFTGSQLRIYNQVIYLLTPEAAQTQTEKQRAGVKIDKKWSDSIPSPGT